MGIAQQSFDLWGGEATVVVMRSSRLAAAREAVDRVVGAVDAACSGYRDDSDLARVNGAAGGSVPVSELFLEVLEAALRAARLTGGLVDPTCTDARPGVSYPHRTVRGPSSAVAGTVPMIVPAAPRPDWRSIQVDPGAGTVCVPVGVRLDFGALGKACAADKAAAAAAAATGCGVLVALAGDIAVAGPLPTDGWRVRVADDHRRGVGGRLPPGQDITLHAPGGLATSSLAVRTRRMPDGRIVNHIVDPRTGMPVRGPWRTVSVSAGTCVDANTASTAALVEGNGAGGRLAADGLPARLVHADGWVHTVAGWPADHTERPGIKVAG